MRAPLMRQCQTISWERLLCDLPLRSRAREAASGRFPPSRERLGTTTRRRRRCVGSLGAPILCKGASSGDGSACTADWWDPFYRLSALARRISSVSGHPSTAFRREAVA